jgi:hypothetical protein
VHIEYIEGRQGSEIAGYGPVPDTVLDSHDGRLLGLADHLMANTDRNPENWITTEDGRVVGIDHGTAFEFAGADYEQTYADGPFAARLYDHTGPDDPVPAARNDFTPADMATLHGRLDALRPQFERTGRGEWHTAMMRRFAAIEHAAHGSTNRIPTQPGGRDTTGRQQ